MRINLDEPEIQQALVGYIENQGIDLSTKQVSVELQAGRGVNGHKAFIEILPSDTSKDSSSNPGVAGTSEDMDVPEISEESPAIDF